MGVPNPIHRYISLLHQGIPECDVIKEVGGEGGGVLANPEITPQVQGWITDILSNVTSSGGVGGCTLANPDIT